jgi:hypothetical protein
MGVPQREAHGRFKGEERRAAFRNNKAARGAAVARSIMAKVNELMAGCTELEAGLTTTQTDSRRLLEAVLHEALAPAMEEAA